MSSIKSRRHVELYYLKGTVKDDDTVYPVMDLVTVPYDGIKFYSSFFFRISQVSPCATLFYYWAVMEMSGAMVITTDEFTRTRFLKYSKKLGFEYHDGSVKRVVAELLDMELFIKLNRGRCKINAEFCYRGKEQERIEQIKLDIRKAVDMDKYTVNKKGEIIKK